MPIFDQSPGQEQTDATVIQHAIRGRMEDMIRWGLISEDIILEMEHDLRGDVYDEKTGKWESATVKVYNKETKVWETINDNSRRLCNEYCINKFRSILRARLGKNTYLSNIDLPEMKLILRFLGWDLADLLFTQYENLGIKEEDMSLIFWSVFDLCEFSMRRAVGEGERKFIQTIRAVIEKVIGGEEKKEEGRSYKNLWFGGGGNKQ
jgi:hypothetical protein